MCVGECHVSVNRAQGGAAARCRVTNQAGNRRQCASATRTTIRAPWPIATTARRSTPDDDKGPLGTARVPSLVATPLLSRGVGNRTTETETAAGQLRTYWRLTLIGVETVAPLRSIGRPAIAGAPSGGPSVLCAPPRRCATPYSLSRPERQAIASSRAQTPSECGRWPNGSSDRPRPSARELRRNVLPHDNGVYEDDLAEARARERAERQQSGQGRSTPQDDRTGEAGPRLEP